MSWLYRQSQPKSRLPRSIMYGLNCSPIETIDDIFVIPLQRYYIMETQKRKKSRREPVHTTLSEVERKKAEAIADSFGGVTVSEALRRLVWDYELKTPSN
jgi:hypothetical protein